jgi:hypothetical protein
VGARWDAKKKVWFLPDGADASALRRWYWMNRCEHCGMKQGDFELFSEPDEAFLPFSAARTAAIRVEEFREPFGGWAGEFRMNAEFSPE